MADNISILAPAWGASGPEVVKQLSDIFQFSPPRGGRQQLQSNTEALSISILAPAWGASISFHSLSVGKLFQFSPPRGGRPRCRRWWRTGQNFNSRPRVGGVLQAVRERMQRERFQFSPPRGGRQVRRAHLFAQEISILAPAWGASVLNRYVLTVGIISILAPAWGASLRHLLHSLALANFNSRPRVGGVLASCAAMPNAARFQFSPPRGGRPSGVFCGLQFPCYFNSRPRVGGVPWTVWPVAACPYFNSRPRVGGVLTMHGAQDLSRFISILAPAWGASDGNVCALDIGRISILAPAWGASEKAR